MVYRDMKATEYTKDLIKMPNKQACSYSTLLCTKQGCSFIRQVRVYEDTKTTEYTKFVSKTLKTSISAYKKGLPYRCYTEIQRLQSIQNLFLKN